MPCSYCKASHKSQDCPLWRKQLALTRIKSRNIKENYFGSAPTVFVGNHGYPDINVGILSPGEISSNPYDDPKQWSVQEFSIPQIIDLRSQLINSRTRLNIKSSEKHLLIAQEVSLASNAPDVEFFLKKIPAFKIRLDYYSAPMGPSAELKKAEITSNTKIDKKVEKTINDELKADESVNYLYKSGFDESFLTRVLSTGNLGRKKKLVPTRWSITAVDDILSKNLIEEIKNNTFSDYQAFFGNFMGNYYLIMFFPDSWSYELFERSIETKGTSIDYEGFDGRKDYARNCVGGYYTVRLAVSEKLRQMKKQAGVLALRFITKEYLLPLGVWITREASRKTLSNKPINFASKELMLDYAKLVAKKKFGIDLTSYFDSCWFLKNVERQKRLNIF